MIANVSAHRRANAFAQALEEQVLEGAAAEQTEVDNPAANAGQKHDCWRSPTASGNCPNRSWTPRSRLSSAPSSSPRWRPRFAEGAPSERRTRVPEQRTGPGRAPGDRSLGKLRPRSRLSKGLAAGGLTVGVAAGAFSGVAAASSDALPGDSLYGLKRGMEDLKLGMADDDSDRGRALPRPGLHPAERGPPPDGARPGRRPRPRVPRRGPRALSGMQHDASEGHRLLHEAYERDGSLGPIQALNSFSQSHRDAWARCATGSRCSSRTSATRSVRSSTP